MTQILVVEDSPTQAAEISFVIEEGGFAVDSAADGPAALRRLADGGIAAVVADVIMPEMSGYELCRAIRADPRTTDLPVLLLTTLNKPEDVLRGLECGADGYMNKPFDPDSLVRRIRQMLAASAAARNRDSPADMTIHTAGQDYVLAANDPRAFTYLASAMEHCADLRAQSANETARATLALQRSEERFALTAAGANDGLWDWDLNTNEIHVSPRFLEITGDPQGTVLTPNEWIARVHPEDRERSDAEFRAHLTGELPGIRVEHRLRRPDGSYRWVLVRGRSVRDAGGKAYRLAGSLTDIHERKDIEHQLLDATAELHAVFHAFPDLYCWLDANAVIYRTLGYNLRAPGGTEIECSGKDIREVLLATGTTTWDEALAWIRSTETVIHVECTATHAPGFRRYNVRLAALPDGCALAIVHDMTGQQAPGEVS